jgi:hypothetical protein
MLDSQQRKMRLDDDVTPPGEPNATQWQQSQGVPQHGIDDEQEESRKTARITLTEFAASVVPIHQFIDSLNACATVENADSGKTVERVPAEYRISDGRWLRSRR